MNEVFDYVTKTYGDKDCLGTREFLAEEDEVQPNGKVFKSVSYFLISHIVRHTNNTKTFVCRYCVFSFVAVLWTFKKIV